VGDTKPRFFLGYDRRRSVNGLSLTLRGGHCSGAFDPMLGYATVNITHRRIMT
jgi:hypothetical protein